MKATVKNSTIELKLDPKINPGPMFAFSIVFVISFVGIMLSIFVSPNFVPMAGIPIVAWFLVWFLYFMEAEPEGMFLWKSKKEKYSIYNLDSNYSKYAPYQKAIDDCIEEIKALRGNFQESPWEAIFRELNTAAYEVEEEQKKKTAKIVRPDYADELRTGQKFYNQGIE